MSSCPEFLVCATSEVPSARRVKPDAGSPLKMQGRGSPISEVQSQQSRPSRLGRCRTEKFSPSSLQVLLLSLFLLMPQHADAKSTKSGDSQSDPASSGTGKLLAEVTLNSREAPVGTRLWVFPPKRHDEAITSGWPDEELELVAGKYDIVAEFPVNALEPIRAWKEAVEISPGKTTKIRIDAMQKLGWLRAEVLSNDEPVIAAALMLLPNGKRRGDTGPLSRNVPTSLPPGKYTVGAVLESAGGRISAYVDDVEVKDGKLAEVNVDLGPTGILEVRVKGGSYSDGIHAGLIPKGAISPVGLLMSFSPEQVKAGSYDLRLQTMGAFRQYWWHRDVEVVPGETTVVEVEGPPVKLP